MQPYSARGRGFAAFQNLSSVSEWSSCHFCINLSALGLLFTLVISLRLLLEEKTGMWPLDPYCAAAILAQLTGWWWAGSAEEGGEYLTTACSVCSLSKEENYGQHRSQRTLKLWAFRMPWRSLWPRPDSPQTITNVNLEWFWNKFCFAIIQVL